jgi:hypothetical protein
MVAFAILGYIVIYRRLATSSLSVRGGAIPVDRKQ